MLAKAASKNSFVTHGLPFLAFLIVGWYGLASVVQSKRELRNATKGIESLEELDPVERMRRRYGIGEPGTVARAADSAPISSLEEELEATLKKIDIKDFDYKPVPRPAEDDE